VCCSAFTESTWSRCTDSSRKHGPRLTRIWQLRESVRRNWFPRARTKRNEQEEYGSKIDDFLKDEGIFEEAQAQAIKEVVAWQLAEAMKKKKISKNKMATLLKTSRTQVDRILDPKNDITLGSLQRAAAMVGRRVKIDLV
jgi:antitoxin HicB